MDIQFVSNPYACIEYIIKYITKEERDMGTLLQAVAKETKDAGIREQMKKCGQTFLNARSVSVQEAAYRLLGLPLYKSNFDSVSIPSGLPEERVRLLKSLNTLDNLDDDDENVFVADLLENMLPDQIGWRTGSWLCLHHGTNQIIKTTNQMTSNQMFWKTLRLHMMSIHHTMLQMLHLL